MELDHRNGKKEKQKDIEGVPPTYILHVQG